MKTYFEIIAQDVIPGMRALLAKDLMDKYGLTQKEAAEKLGLTQAAISQYMRDIRGYKVKLLQKDSKIIEEILALSKRLAANELTAELATEEICKICSLAIERGLIKQDKND